MNDPHDRDPRNIQHRNKRDALTDEALAVFAFAAYHQLESGEPVSRVVIEDGAGHQADRKAIAELTDRGLARTENNRIVFTSDGEAVLSAIIDAMRKAGGGISS